MEPTNEDIRKEERIRSKTIQIMKNQCIRRKYYEKKRSKTIYYVATF